MHIGGCIHSTAKMRALSYILLLLSITVETSIGQAPGDEDEFCLKPQVRLRDGRNPDVNKIILMSNLNYFDLTESKGGPWIVRDLDNNNNYDWSGKPTVSNNTIFRLSYWTFFSGQNIAAVVPDG